MIHSIKALTTGCCISLILACIASNAQACPKTNCVRVGSWNLEWLGSENRPEPADTKTLHAMADLIANQLSIDIIALQEVNTDLDGTRRGEHFSLTPWHKLQSELQSYGYQLSAGKSGYAQHVVLAWRQPVTVVNLPSDLAVPDHYDLHPYCRSSNLRQPLAGLFRAGHFDFWLVGLHLKANGPDNACTSAIRTRQVADLLIASRELLETDPDIILLGDFNASSKHKSLKQLADFGFMPLDDRNRRSSSSNRYSYHSANSKNASGGLIDHIMIRQATQQEWQARSTIIYKAPDAEEFAQTLSDHHPLWSDFYTGTDDD